MTKEAKIKKFKFAFLKPAAPNKELVKLKTKMEKEMKTASKKAGTREQLDAAENVQKLLKEVHAKDPKYYQQLLSYKMTKHWGEPREFKVWAEKAVDEGDVVKFLDDMMGDNPSDDLVAECFFHVPKIVPMIKKCWDKSPDRIVQMGVAYVEKNKSRHSCDLAGYESVAYPGTAIYVAKSKSSGNYVLKETDDRGALKAAANRNGFSTAYRLTTNLDRYAKLRT